MQSEFPHSTPCLSRSCRFGKWVIESDVLRCSYNSLPCCLAAMPFPDFCGGNMAVPNWQISSAFHCMITKKAGSQYTNCATSVPCENTAGQKWSKVAKSGPKQRQKDGERRLLFKTNQEPDSVARKKRTVHTNSIK